MTGFEDLAVSSLAETTKHVIVPQETTRMQRELRLRTPCTRTKPREAVEIASRLSARYLLHFRVDPEDDLVQVVTVLGSVGVADLVQTIEHAASLDWQNLLDLFLQGCEEKNAKNLATLIQ